MKKFSLGLATSLLMLLALVCFIHSQLASQDKPLGDVARQQRKAVPTKSQANKKYTNAEVASGPVARDSEGPREESPSAAESKPGETRKAAEQPGAGNRRSILDRPLGEKPDPIVVPAGTEIRVDVVEGKVIVPVRVGFATPIPALSTVAVQINRNYNYTGLFMYHGGYARYSDYAALTAVTVDGVTYPVQSNAIPLASPGSSAVTLDNTVGSSVHDVTFTLSTSLSIPR